LTCSGSANCSSSTSPPTRTSARPTPRLWTTSAASTYGPGVLERVPARLQPTLPRPTIGAESG
jgi:hypothetical protein